MKEESKREELADGMTREEIIEENSTYRNQLLAHRMNQDGLFDKYIISCSAGLFGISFAFIHTIVPVDAALLKPLLPVSWMCFLLCIVFCLIGYRTASALNEKIRKDADNVMISRLEGKNTEYKKMNGFYLPNIQNYVSLSLFIAGTVCLMLFTAVNLL